MTAYVVLRDEGGGSWRELDTIDSTNSLRAIEALATVEGRYLALPQSHIANVEPVARLKITTARSKGE